ncbi:methyl-accepting chemotaxis protein [unidentified bacterial endosymbiont]|uniref:methyl-accepting chemotaxis protein n=1 Tax=unidentified bacterial endosymbiont TaxID=2355 RepID=UPI00209D6A53|nr:methyl-accepting chemotaxis protein [unidentified bacterial endosymbiont]
MDNTTSMQAQHSLGFLHHIRLVPLFSSILGGIIILFALSVGLAGYFLLQADLDQQDLTAEIQVRTGLSNSSNHLRTARINMIHAGAASRIAEMEAMKQNIDEAQARIKQSQAGFAAYMGRGVRTPADEALDAELNARYADYIAGLQPMLKYAKNGMFEAIINHENESARPLDDAYNSMLLKAIKLRTDRANALTAQAHTRTQLGLMIMPGAFVLALGLTAMTFIVLRRTVINPLQRAATRIEKIAKGDLTLPDDSTSRSEIGRLTRDLQTMQHSLVTTVGSVRQGAEEIYRGTSEISAGNTDLSSRTEQQAAAIEQTAASMEQLTATVKQNTDNAHHACKLAEDASGKASRGGQMVSGVVKTMGNISTSSKKISEITAVINSIAFQTNILALNAAVEAARAGEQGRGFAVVASEVRTLASRSANAAKEIESLINESVNLIDQGSGEVVAAGNTMNEIVKAVKRVTDIMLEIAAASDEQSRGIVQVSQAISEMDKVTQQNASLVEEASAAASSLEEQGARLTEAVGAFRLNGTTASRTFTSAPERAQLRPAAAVSGKNGETF